MKTFKLFIESLNIDHKSILIEFVNFLPMTLPQEIEDLVNSANDNLGTDGAFYMLIGAYIEKFGKETDLLSELTIESEDELFELLDDKYGAGVIEW